MALILDFVGHADATAQQLRALLPGTVVVDVGASAMATLRGLLSSQVP